MKKNDLIIFMEDFIKNTSKYGLELKFLYHIDKEFLSYKPDLEETHLKPKLLNDFLAVLRNTFIAKDEEADFELVNINKGEATDTRTIYHISQNKIPVASKIFNAPDVSLYTQFEFKKQELSSIWGVLIKIGNSERSITLFKKNYPVNVIKKSSTYQLFFKSGALQVFNDDIIKLSNKFDVALINDELIIIDKKEFENHFEYIAAMEKEANQRIDSIIAANIIDDASKIYDLSKKKRTLKKILNIDSNNVIFKTEPKKIISFAKKYKLALELTEDKTRISITSQKSAEVFIKLLNDDYLISELTKLLYDSRGKKQLA